MTRFRATKLEAVEISRSRCLGSLPIETTLPKVSRRIGRAVFTNNSTGFGINGKRVENVQNENREYGTVTGKHVRVRERSVATENAHPEGSIHRERV